MLLKTYLESIAGLPLKNFLTALMFAFACFGVGRTFFRKKDEKPSPFAVFALGLFISAPLFLVVFQFCGTTGLQSAFTIFNVFGLFQAIVHNGELKAKKNFFLLFPLALLLFAAGNLLVPPSGWDECVYQLSVPVRWLQAGKPVVFGDLPYSGFPLLPQFCYLPLIQAAGAGAGKTLALLVLGVAVLSITLFGRHSKRTAALAAVLAFSLLSTPIVLHMECNTYAEPFLALGLISALLLLQKKHFALAGLCAGGAAAVKLSGLFIPFFLLLWILSGRERRSRKNILCFLAGCLLALPFYLRPLILTGNPFYPYFADFFPGTPENVLEMSGFHHAIGFAPFGSDSPLIYLLAPIMMAFRKYNTLFDGTWEIQSLLILLPVLAYIVLKFRKGRRRSALAMLLPLLFFYGTWWFSPQARFLLPCMILLAIFAVKAVSVLPKRYIRLYTALVLLVSIVGMFLTNYPANTLQRIRHSKDIVNQFYSETGATYLLAADMLQHAEGKVLLLFEERALYMPKNCLIATPFFQSSFFTPPDAIQPENIIEIMHKNNVRWLYFRIPNDNPDLDAKHLNRCEKFFDSLKSLIVNGKLKTVPAGNGAMICELP